MLNLKKTAVAVLALGSSAVFAGSMGPVCAPGNVTIPCEKTMWNVGAQALYLQPVYAAEGIAPRITGGGSANANPGKWTAPQYSANWGWGFMIEGSYHYGMGNDVNVNWYHVNNATQVSGVVKLAGDAVNSVRAENISIHPEWDAVNVEFGQHVDFGDMKSVRLHGGVEYARIATGFSGLARQQVGINPAGDWGDAYEQQHSTFNGFGPRGGIDMNYDLGNGFSAYGNGAGGILVGSGGFNQSITAYNGTTGAASFNGSKTTLVPELEAKLGLKYNYNLAAMGFVPQGDLVLDVGWMWVNYFNAQQFGANEGIAAGTTGQGVTRGVVSSSDFGEQGLNFGLKWIGSI